MNDFEYEVDDGKVTITRYKGNGGDVVVPDTIDGLPVNRIGSYAFQGCTSLTSITFGNSLTDIEEYAFQGCTSLTSITLPNSITTIGEYAFRRCHSLISISVPDGCSIGEGAFEGCQFKIRNKEAE